jgi:hypothetical protein
VDACLEGEHGHRALACLHAGHVDVRLRPGEREQLLDRRLAEGAAHRPVLAHAADECARVDLLQRDDAFRGEPVRERGPRAPRDDPARVRASRLHPGRIHPVVADQRIREAEHLRGVARVGDGLLVARHRGGEAGLAGRGSVRAHGTAREDGSVLEN